MKTFKVYAMPILSFVAFAASASSPSVVKMNALLNEGSCGQDTCSVKVCAVNEKKCSFYVCSAAQSCRKVATVDMTEAEIKAAMKEAEKKN